MNDNDTTLNTIDDEGFLHLHLGGDSNLVQLAKGFRDTIDNGHTRKACTTVRISLSRCALRRVHRESCFDPSERAFPASVDGRLEQERAIAAYVRREERAEYDRTHDCPERVQQFVDLLKSLLAAQPKIESITFNNGFISDTDTLPLVALAVVLLEATALQRLELHNSRVACFNEEQFEDVLQIMAHSKTRAIMLRECQLCSCSVVCWQGEESICLDPLISLFVHGFPHLEGFFSYNPSGCHGLKNETLVDLCYGRAVPNLKELRLSGFEILGDHHLVTLCDALTNQEIPSPLLRLHIDSTLTNSGVAAIARCLSQEETSLQELTIRVTAFMANQRGEADWMHAMYRSCSCCESRPFFKPRKGPVMKDDGYTTSDPANVQPLMEILVDTLKVNQTLQIFQLCGQGGGPSHALTLPGTQKLFADMLQHNYTLQELSFNEYPHNIRRAEDDDDGSQANIQMYLKLNQYGRRVLLLPDKEEDRNCRRSQWIDAIIHFRVDLNYLFYLLQTNPSLCHTVSLPVKK